MKEEWFKAIEDNDLEAVRSLIGSGFDVNTKNQYEETGLMVSAEEEEKLEISKLLLAQPNIDRKCKDIKGRTVLHIVQLFNNKKLFNILLCRNEQENKTADIKPKIILETLGLGLLALIFKNTLKNAITNIFGYFKENISLKQPPVIIGVAALALLGVAAMKYSCGYKNLAGIYNKKTAKEIAL